MTSCTCQNCGAKLCVDENDLTPGCREMEEVFCPVCHELVTRVFTSGIPVVSVEKSSAV